MPFQWYFKISPAVPWSRGLTTGTPEYSLRLVMGTVPFDVRQTVYNFSNTCVFFHNRILCTVTDYHINIHKIERE